MGYVFLDVENDSLFGEVIAIGAVYYKDFDSISTITQNTSIFEGAIRDIKTTDFFVVNNVLPSLINMTKYDTREDLLNGFWKWYIDHKGKDKQLKVVVDAGFPVEAGMFFACQNLDESRAFSHPYPLFDVGTMLEVNGIDPDINRDFYAGMLSKVTADSLLQKHNPLYDAMVSALCWKKGQKIIEERRIELEKVVDAIQSSIFVHANVTKPSEMANSLIAALHDAQTELLGLQKAYDELLQRYEVATERLKNLGQS